MTLRSFLVVSVAGLVALPGVAGAAPADDVVCGVVGAPSAVGCAQWSARYDGAGSVDFPAETAISPDGTIVFVTGASVGDSTGGPLGRYDIATVAYNAATGTELWHARYDGPGAGYDTGTGLAVSPDGSTLYVGGESAGAGTGSDLVLIAYDAGSGAVQDIERSDTAMFEGAYRGFVMSPDGSQIVFAGTATGAGTGWDFNTVAFDTATLSRRWVSRWNGPNQEFSDDGQFIGDITMSADGSRVFVTGNSMAAGSSALDYATVAYDAADGRELWVARYASRAGGNNLPYAIVASPDGERVFVTGASDGNVFPSSSWDYTTVAYDADSGKAQWVHRFHGPSDWLWGAGLVDAGSVKSFNASGDLANDIVISADSASLFVTGFSSLLSVGNRDIATISIDAATGDEIWMARYDGPAHRDEYPAGLVLSPDDRTVYVAGTSGGAVDKDVVVVAYSTTTGRPMWTTRTDNGGADFASALSIAPDGSRLVVTGSSDAMPGGSRSAATPDGDTVGAGTYADFVTTAYSTTWPPALNLLD